MAIDAEPVLYENPEITGRPLQKSSETYANLTRKGNVELPSPADLANQDADKVLAEDAAAGAVTLVKRAASFTAQAPSLIPTALAQPFQYVAKAVDRKDVDQAYRYIEQAGGSAENAIIKGMFSLDDDTLPEDLKQVGAAGIMEFNGVLNGLTRAEIKVQPETLKMLHDRRISPEIAYGAGQIVGGFALMAAVGAAMGAERLGAAAAAQFYRHPLLARMVEPAIRWGMETGGAGAIQEGIRQVREGKLDVQRFGKVILNSTAMGLVGGAVSEGFPAGVLRIAGSAAYGFGAKRFEGGTIPESMVNAGIFGLLAAASTNQATRAQKAGALATASRNIGEATRAESIEKGYTPEEAEQRGTAASNGFEGFVQSKGGVDNLDVKQYDQVSKEAWDVVKNMTEKPPEPVEQPKQLEEPSKPESAGGRITPVEPETPLATTGPLKPEPVETTSPATSTPPEAGKPQKQPWEMAPDELDAGIKAAKTEEKQSAIDVFGPEKAKVYEQLYRKSQSTTDLDSADAASAEIRKMEGSLTEPQRNRLFGIGEPGLGAEELRGYKDALNGLDFTSAKDLGDSLKYAVTDIGEKTNPNDMDHREKVAYATIRYAKEEAERLGFDLNEVGDAAIKASASRFSDPEDAAFMLGRYAKPQGAPQGKLPEPPAAAPAREFSSTQANLPEAAATKVKSLAAAIPEADLAPDGRETEPHITVKYGIHGNDVGTIRRAIENHPPITVKLGATSIFPDSQSGSGDVVKIDVDSPDLHRLNKIIKDAVPTTDTHPTYQPHVTIAYVKPGLGAKYSGNKSLAGTKVQIDKIVFSGKDGKDTEIQLKGAQAKKPGKKLGKPMSASQFVRANGRINPNMPESSDIRELDRFDLMDTVNGKSADHMRELLAEAGYLAKDSTVGDMMDMLKNDIAGRKTYSSRDVHELSSDVPVQYINDDELQKRISDMNTLLWDAKLPRDEQKLLAELLTEQQSRKEQGIVKPSAAAQEKAREDMEARLAKEKDDAGFEAISKALDELNQTPYDLLRKNGRVGDMFIFPSDSKVEHYRAETFEYKIIHTPDQVETEVKDQYISKDLKIWKKEFMDEVKRKVDGRPLSETPMIHIDFDGLREMNAKMGHFKTNQMFKIFAQKLTEYGFQGVRTGGDEFVALLNPIDKGGADPLEALERFEQFQKEMLEAEVVDNETDEVIHRGLTMSAGFGTDAESADAAAIRAKNQGKGQIILDKSFLERYNLTEGTHYEWPTKESDPIVRRAGKALSGSAPNPPGPGPGTGEALQRGQPQQEVPETPKSEKVNLGGQVQDQLLAPGTPERTLPPTGTGGPKVPQVEDRMLLDEFRPDNQPDLPTGETPEGPTLRSEIIPGLPQFIESDVAPAAKEILKIASDTFRQLGHLIAPRAYGSPAAVDALMKMKGDREKAQFQLESSMEKIKAFFAGRSIEDNIAFIDRLKTGQPQPDPGLQEIADTYRKLDDEIYSTLKEFRPKLSFLENHFRVLWKVIPGSKEANARLAKAGRAAFASKRPLQGSKGYFKQHVLEDMSEGIRMGGVPVTYNPETMFELHFADVMKFVTAQKMWKVGKEIDQIRFVGSGDQRPEGFSRVDDTIARVYFPTDEGLVKAGEWYVQNDFARLLNNYLSRDLIRENSLGKGMLWVKNATTAVELGLSPFHAIFETTEIMSSSLGLGIRKMLEPGRRAEGLKDFLSFLGSPRSVAKEGGAAILYAGNRSDFEARYPDAYKWFTEKYPEAALLIDDLFTSGAKMKMHEDYRTDTAKTMREAWQENNYIGAVLRALPELNQAILGPLFNVYIPRLKIGQFLREYSFELSQRADDLKAGKVTRADLSRQVWSSIENRFGEMNFDNLFWNRTFKSGLQMLVRSITWKLGNLSEYDSAIRGQLLEFRDAAKERRAPRMTRSFGWLAGMALTTALQAVLITKLLTKKYPWELADDATGLVKNLVYPRTSATNPRERVSAIGYWRDLFHLLHTPVNYVTSSLTGEIGRLLDAMQNKDYYGVQVFNPNDPLVQKAWDITKHIIPMPFSFSNFKMMEESGESARKSAMSFFGFNKAPAWVSQSAAERKAGEFIQQRMPAVRTKEEYDRSEAAREVLNSLRGQGQVVGKIARAIREGKIQDNQAMQVYRKSQMDTLQRAVRVLPIGEAVQVLKVATPAERQALKVVVFDKLANSFGNLPADKARLMLKEVRKFYPAKQ
jgi:GGDEF domain-containing protein/2'-5' RNA ligase